MVVGEEGGARVAMRGGGTTCKPRWWGGTVMVARVVCRVVVGVGVGMRIGWEPWAILGTGRRGGAIVGMVMVGVVLGGQHCASARVLLPRCRWHGGARGRGGR
jgi:hypothetical protein